MSEMLPEPWHDPELPFLDVLEQDLRRKAERAEIRHQQRQHFSSTWQRPSHSTAAGGAHLSDRAGTSQGSPSKPRLRGDLPRTSIRIARRSLILLALLSLIGASAYGASKVFSGSTPNPLAPRQGAYAAVASGRSGADTWKLGLYTRGNELCRVLAVGEVEASQCAEPPSATGIEATSAESPARRYAFGVTGAGVLQVHVRLGNQSATVATHLPGQRQRRTAGLPAGMRFYVVALPRPADDGSPEALVQGIGAHGKALARPVPSCLETGEPGHC
jgi:hypothetical protein